MNHRRHPGARYLPNGRAAVAPALLLTLGRNDNELVRVSDTLQLEKKPRVGCPGRVENTKP